MSLVFGAGNTNRVVAVGSATLDDIGAFTQLCWCYPTTLNSTRTLICKGSTGFKEIRLSGTTGNLQLTVQRATTSTSFITNSTPLSGLNAWYLVAATFDSAASPVGHIYTGTLSAEAVEAAYGTQTGGSGGVTTDATLDLNIGNAVGANLAFNGRIAVAAYIAGALTLGQIIDWQFRPRVIAGTRGFWIPGYNGATNVPDLSGNGNTGTITGATVADHVPLPAPFGRDDGWAPYVVAGAATLPPGLGPDLAMTPEQQAAGALAWG